ncbi:MAG: ParA family protein [Deltaproteobacteria bacterium]|nr:ParA family protein [Deltaproteobacteria bacterium]
MPIPWFDDSLRVLVDTLQRALGTESVQAGVVLRDASGRLTFYSREELADEKREQVSTLLRTKLLAYAREDRVVVGCDLPGAARILTDPQVRLIEVGGVDIRYVDRRVVGADWLTAPKPIQTSPPRFVFASLKGGVGRSTALSVVAAEHARRGHNVLVVDLDLEAPGVGSLLLGHDRYPRHGALDYLVERNLRPLVARDLDELIGTSGLTSGAGLVDVVPVAGSRSLEEPHNYLSKLARAMIEGMSNGELPLADKLREMLAALESRRSYDLVLVDARAGLAELAAGPLLALGANVLLFGTAQPQTLEGLRFLFAHLLRFIPPESPSPGRALRMIHAKSQLKESHERFKDDLWELFAEYLYEEQNELEGFNFDVNAPNAPHNPIPIPLDPAFADWNPVEKPDMLVEEYYARTFAGLLRFVDDVIEGSR